MRISLVGATGLVGRQFLALALESERIDEVVALVRRPLELRHPKLSGRVVDFERLCAGVRPMPFGALGTSMVITLGTTIRAAGSQEAFARVDRDYVLACARWGRDSGVKNLCVVTATGADPRSRIFYNRVKGQTEQGLRELGFASTHVLRPSLLLGERAESRPGERLAQKLSPFFNPLLVGRLQRYRAVDSIAVARSLLEAAIDPRGGHFVHESETFR